MRHAFIASALLCVGVTLAAQEADRAAAIVAQARTYFLEHEQRLTGIVAEERQTQRQMTAGGTVAKERVLVSDAMFVTVGDTMRYFRDVVSVDGKPVRNREERLRNLFLRKTREPIVQARAIFDESRRYDLKLTHWSSALLLPTLIIKPANIDRFRFATAEGGVSFDEAGSPTLARAGDAGARSDQPMRGRLTIDPETGALRAASIAASNDLFGASIDVRYGNVSGPAALIPIQVRETYRRPTRPQDDYLEVTSEYSNIRRFEVTAEQTIDLPK